ncbi:hypothetical protein KIN20_021589 [Parelaphostrongylus tenuis]|uniref:Uncharacterized protein n=1 Tax=Parelaphostrongylus tenuis TaxID=148309 RepID=A0AAD5QWA7_PARTN|nr:hypothetical protein KIN20_021589 [Parelaphostrongylus tenuis]
MNAILDLNSHVSEKAVTTARQLYHLPQLSILCIEQQESRKVSRCAWLMLRRLSKKRREVARDDKVPDIQNCVENITRMFRHGTNAPNAGARERILYAPLSQQSRHPANLRD